MEQPSRRHLLKAGGVLGALGALTVATPAQASSLWTWSAKGSVVGTGQGADPRWVWDAEADPLVASLIDSGQVPQINTLLQNWTQNGQPLPAGLPTELAQFIEKARQLPSWADQTKLAAAFEFNQARGTYLGVCYGFVSGMMSTAIPHEARAVYYSKGGADMKDRITKTAKLGYDIGTQNAFAPDGQMIVTCIKTRLAHAGVRHLLPQSPYWSSGADQNIPISQADMMVTWHSLPTTVMRQLTKWNVPVSDDESAGFLHSWQLTAHMLGILDEYIPSSWDEANSQATQVLDPIIAPTPEGVDLAHILLDLAANIDGGLLTTHILGALSRYMLGDKIADWLQIPREPVWDPAFQTLWPIFVDVKEGLLKITDAPPALLDVYWAFDEILRLGVLIFLSGAKFPISIQIPTTNNPNL